jgi:DNA-binding PadR family transcriptional regulator
MRSVVNWALLGLVIDRSSYAYELAQRFERTYGDALALSSVSHVYTAIGTLRDRGLIEELPGTREGRQPKPHYRATESGITEYREWLAGQICEDRQRQRLFIQQLAALSRHPEAALEIVGRYEEACLEEASKTPISAANDEGERASELVTRLASEERRLAVGPKLEWAQYARQAFQALADAQQPGQ